MGVLTILIHYCYQFSTLKLVDDVNVPTAAAFFHLNFVFVANQVDDLVATSTKESIFEDK